MLKLRRRILLAVCLLVCTCVFLLVIFGSFSNGAGLPVHLFDNLASTATSNGRDTDPAGARASGLRDDSGHMHDTFYEILKDSFVPKVKVVKGADVLEPCTVINPFNHAFIDLRGLSSLNGEGKALPWVAKGYTSGHNYTVGICSSPFKKPHNEPNDIVGEVPSSSQVGAYYFDSHTNQYVSLGEYSTTPKYVGRKLTLTYENGSYCDNFFDNRSGQMKRRSTLLIFTCDREMMSKAVVSYIGSFDDCSYIFEVRSHHACPTAPQSNNLAAIWIFLFILFTAFLVYLSGGILYRQMKFYRLPKDSP